MLFDLSNYLFFILFLAALYTIFSLVLQDNIGGKGRLKAIQKEVKEVQQRMIEAGKRKDDKTMNDEMAQNMKLSMELMAIQMKMLFVVLGVLFLLMLFFPHVEPGMGDDITLQLYDDGLPAHCDDVANDLNYSGCLQMPANGAKGAWVVDAFLKTSTNETIVRNGTAIYVEGGEPWHIWVQNVTSGSIWDGILGKRNASLRLTTDKADYQLGDNATVVASVSPAPQRGERVEAVADSGTFFYVDLPYAIPLLNIRRIIGSYGVFIFSVFVLSMLFSIGKAAYGKMKKT